MCSAHVQKCQKCHVHFVVGKLDRVLCQDGEPPYWVVEFDWLIMLIIVNPGLELYYHHFLYADIFGSMSYIFIPFNRKGNILYVMEHQSGLS